MSGFFIDFARRTLSFAVLATVGISTLLPLSGCNTVQPVAERSTNPGLRPIEAPPGGTPADIDRAALARFIGVWNFEGWSSDSSGARKMGAGRAAAAINCEHFVLIDLQAATGQVAGRSGSRAGRMMLASEPGLGSTLTAWGDASPAIARFYGRIEGNGAAFSFTEAKTPAGLHSHTLTFVFQTDDHWTAEVQDCSMPGKPVIASYTFTRSSP